MSVVQEVLADQAQIERLGRTPPKAEVESQVARNSRLQLRQAIDKEGRRIKLKMPGKVQDRARLHLMARRTSLVLRLLDAGRIRVKFDFEIGIVEV